MKTRLSVLLVCLLYRLLFALITRTTFIPDEYFQSIEPAYYVIETKGVLTWEWRDGYQIRSFISLFPYILLFKLLKLWDYFGIFNIVAPRLAQGVFAGISDFVLFETVRVANDGNSDIAKWVTGLHLLSWSLSYGMHRILINSFETGMIIIIQFLLLSSYDDSRHSHENRNIDKKLGIAIFLSTWTIYIRPTAILLLAPIWVLKFLKSSLFTFHNMLCALVICVAVIYVSMALDSVFYGEPVLPPLSFFQINLVEDYASLYGIASWHWMISSAIPTLLGGYLLLVIWIILDKVWCVDRVVVVSTMAKSGLVCSMCFLLLLGILSKHQEFRFYYCILPNLHWYLGEYFYSRFHYQDHHGHHHHGHHHGHHHHGSYLPWKQLEKKVLLILGGIHVLVALYLSLFHQSGTERIGVVIHDHWKNMIASRTNHDDGVDCHIFLWAPCHSFPGQAAFPSHCTLHFPDCSPRLKREHQSQSDRFQMDPFLILQQALERPSDYYWSGGSSPSWRFFPSSSWTANSTARNEWVDLCSPDEEMKHWRINYIVTFDGYLSDDSSYFLQQSGFEKVATSFHSFFHFDLDDPVTKKNVVLYFRSE